MTVSLAVALAGVALPVLASSAAVFVRIGRVLEKLEEHDRRIVQLELTTGRLCERSA